MLAKSFTKLGFTRSYVLPALLLFAVPVMGVVFARHATSSFDQSFFTDLGVAVKSDAQFDAARREEIVSFFREHPASSLCAEGPPARDALPQAYAENVCGSFAQLRWIEQASLGCIGLGTLSLLIAVLCVALSFISRSMQRLSFLAGFHFLRFASALQVIAQGFIATMLSFWVTAFYFERYSIKLIAIVGVVAACAAAMVLRAIFKTPDDKLAVEGELLSREKSPSLWSRIEEICARLGTEPPDHIVGGIDDNFFVTEHPVHLPDPLPKGRTLFVSLSLLKRLDRNEADAILAHEMAHFSGGDTQYSKRLAPVLARFAAYLEALQRGGLSLPIFYFMLFYWSAFHISLSKTRRERELRADKLASEVTSPASVANALLKVAAYSAYRGRVEAGLFQRNQRHSSLDIAHSIADGFVEYASGDGLEKDLDAENAFPHPFDSHPALALRIANVGAVVAKAEIVEVVVNSSAQTWFTEIGDAERIESGLWDSYEQRFTAAHEESLAYRYLPATPEERAHVEKFFPPVQLACKEGTGELVLDCETMRYHEWSEPVAWQSIAKIQAEDKTFGGKHLSIEVTDANGKKRKLSVPLKKLTAKEDAVLEVVSRYYARASFAKAQVEASSDG